MKTKKEIVDNWLPRYTGRELKDFSKYILLTNFEYYLELFSEIYQVPIIGEDKTMPNVCHNGITLINFGMGSPNAATILDLLSAIEPEAVLFIGKCGGLKVKNAVGDYILPIAAIKGEGTSDDYMPHEVPALPAFSIQKACSKIIVQHERQYYTGVVYTTNRRVWEYDDKFKEYLRTTRAMAVEFIWKQSGSPAPDKNVNFTDVASSASYADAVSWALDKGVTSGTSGNMFSPDASCTRAQIVTFLYRASN